MTAAIHISESHGSDFVARVMAHEEDHGKPFNSYCSWRHCYDYFGSNPKADSDKAALYLVSYLASWGMYRGSSFLPKCDFTIHRGAVEIVTSAEATMLRGATVAELLNKHDIIIQLVQDLEKHYKPYHKNEKHPSATLTSKILLGTVGCCVGYDKYVVSGLKTCGLPGTLSKGGLARLHKWAELQVHQIEEAQRKLAACDIEYPHMKLIDMFMWSTGRRSQTREARREMPFRA